MNHKLINKKLLLILIVVLPTNCEDKRQETIQEALQLKANHEYLHNIIKLHLNKEEIDKIEIYQKLSNYLNIEIDSKLKMEIDKLNALDKKIIRNVSSFVQGFFDGESHTVSALASDMVVIGDIRDVVKELSKMNGNQESYDEFKLYISAAGIALSASQVLTMGATTPLKIGVSVLKISNKANKISKVFKQSINSKLLKTIDIDTLQNTLSILNGGNILQDKIDTIYNSFDFSHIEELSKHINIIYNNTDLETIVSVLEYATSENDLAKIAKISNIFKENTLGVFMVLGQDILKYKI